MGKDEDCCATHLTLVVDQRWHLHRTRLIAMLERRQEFEFLVGLSCHSSKQCLDLLKIHVSPVADIIWTPSIGNFSQMVDGVDIFFHSVTYLSLIHI